MGAAHPPFVVNHPGADMPRLPRFISHFSVLALLAASFLVVSSTAVDATAATARSATPSSAEVLAASAGSDRALRIGRPTRHALKALAKQTKKLPHNNLKQKARLKLVRLSQSAKSHASKEACQSVKDLSSYRTALGHTKVSRKPKKKRTRTVDKLADLNALSTQASLLLLGSKKTKKCGGGVAPSNRDETQTTVLESTGDHLKIAVELPKVTLQPESEGGQTFVDMSAPGTVENGAPGQPGIPSTAELFGIPDGAHVSVQVDQAKSVTIDDVKLYPTQPDPVDDTNPPNFGAPPFVAPFVPETPIKGTFPAKPAATDSLGTARDVVIGNVSLFTGQYTPKTDTLTIFTKLILTIKFPGGRGFGGLYCSPYELSASRLLAALLNTSLVHGFCKFPTWRCGEELMVITNASTLAEAQDYADARTAMGFRTRIFQLGAPGVGTTAAEIQTLIRSHLSSLSCLRPSYVALIGDDKLVPTFTGPAGIPSDNPYSMKNDTDELPDVAVGRILGNNAAEVANFVAKINHYESSPPSGPMLNHATIAAQFQDDDLNGQENRTFVWFAETARTGMMRKVVTVDRIYRDNPTATPTKLNDGTPLPASLLKPGFAWDGDGADVSAAWNAGRFLLIHRDHGWSDGWSTPGFGTADVNALTNDNDHLPVLMSINCSSAAYDYDDTSFVQSAVVKPTGGAVAAFGDTRDSPTWHNSQIGLGFVDGLLPHVLTTEGPASPLRLGDALVNGKLRLAGLSSPTTDGNTRNELFLWHLFGDPTMQMYGGMRDLIRFDVSQFHALLQSVPNPGPEGPFWQVEVTMPQALPGQPLTLLALNSDGIVEDAVGKAVGGDSTHVIVPADFLDGSPNQMAVVINADGAEPLTVPVEDNR
jgi:hypothetical protein